MATFSAKTSARAEVAAGRAEIWKALVDPGLVARMTPFVRRITAEGDHWHWQLTGLDLAGRKLAPAFTERMVFEEGRRIEFHHEPPDGVTERAGANGWYDLSDGPGGTRLETSLEICLEAPLPRAAGPAVRAAMKGVMATMGDRFSTNLLDHLGVRH
ncbi:MAG: SRPBCC family protein [Actinomycetota bacterium]|nr:SRPBCC family protein [Actinomycetota bacterium]